MMDISRISGIAGDLCYVALACVALWGAFCVILVWRRVAQMRFRSEEEQQQFLARIDATLADGRLAEATALCEADPRAMPQLALLALRHHDMDPTRIRHLLADRFQRDVLADLDYRLSWVYTMIKTAPMLGLFGTVLGMMSAFGKLGGGQKVDTTGLADDISLALITTAIGLAVAIPLTVCVASVNIRIRKMEDLVGVGLTHVLDTLRGLRRSGGRK